MGSLPFIPGFPLLIHTERPVIAPVLRLRGLCGKLRFSAAGINYLENHVKKLLAALLICSANTAWATPDVAPDRLYTEIAAMDAALFDAFNRKDLDGVMTLFSKDLEFYHDKGGLNNYEQNLKASKRLFEVNKTLRRQLVPGTMQVYPIKDYGAIQTAEHQFCQGPRGTDDCGVFKFLHIWKRTGEGWKLARVVSYGH